MEKIILEIRQAEGGDDAKLLTEDMANIYIKASNNQNFKVKPIEWREGFITLSIQGEGVKQYFSNEMGNHRWQRIPPTERKGRVHTSSITVAIMEELKSNFYLNRSEVRRIFTRGTGAGGQHKNTTDSCVVLTHMPSGIEVKVDGRNQHQNEREAWVILEQRLKDKYMKELYSQVEEDRSSQIGGGERGNKRRTYRVRDNMVIDHNSNKTAQLKDILKGRIELLK